MASSAPGRPVTGVVSAAPVRPRLNPGWGLVIFGGLLGVVGAFLTWATVDYGGVATHTYRGVSAGRDGKITIVLAVLVLGVTAAAFLGWVRGWLRPALLLLGLVIAFVALADLAASPSVGSEEQARLRVAARVTSSNGIGEWLTLVAGILVVIGVVLVARYSRPAAARAGAHSAAAVGVSVRPTPGPLGNPPASRTPEQSVGGPPAGAPEAEAPAPGPSAAEVPAGDVPVPGEPAGDVPAEPAGEVPAPGEPAGDVPAPGEPAGEVPAPAKSAAEPPAASPQVDL